MTDTFRLHTQTNNLLLKIDKSLQEIHRDLQELKLHKPTTKPNPEEK